MPNKKHLLSPLETAFIPVLLKCSTDTLHHDGFSWCCELLFYKIENLEKLLMQIYFIYKVSSGISHGLQWDYPINETAFLSKYFYNNVHKLQHAWLKIFQGSHSNMLKEASRPQANIVSLFFFLNLIKSSKYRDWWVFKLWLTGFQLMWVLYGSQHTDSQIPYKANTTKNLTR